jgi:hypothetical protein
MNDIAASTRRFPRWVPILLVLGALGLRVAGLWWGLPNGQHHFSYHPDEIFLLLPAFKFAEGTLNPHFFNYGTLYLYLVGLPAVALGLVPDPSQFPPSLRSLYLEGRLITALLGCATVLLLYLSLQRESRWLALIAAALLAICPLHVITSHYATVDVPATFFIALAFLLLMRAKTDIGSRAALPVGIAVGLAAATKYNAGMFLIPALLGPVFLGQRPKAGWWLALPAGALLGFLIGNPFVASDEFLRGFLFELRHAREGGTLAFVDTGSGWAYHVLRGLPVGLGYPLLATVVLGLVATIQRRSVAARLSLLWIVLYLVVIGFGKERFIRYLVPLTPFLCVLGAWGIMWLIATAGRYRAQITASLLSVVLVVLALLYTLGQLVPLVFYDTRDYAWLQADSDLLFSTPGATVGLSSPPWFYHPPVSPYNAGELSRPWFEPWNATADTPVIVTGWSADRLQDTTPTVFFLSDLEVDDLLRLGRTDVGEFVSALEKAYSGKMTFGGHPLPFDWLAPPRAHHPPDWLYATPQITMYHGREGP